MAESFSGKEVVEIAVEIEKNGFDFYAELIRKALTPEATQIFTYLAGEEEKHISVFENLFKSIKNVDNGGAFPDEYISYMNKLAGQHVFTQKGQGVKIAKEIDNTTKAFDLGIKFENESIIYYESMKQVISKKDIGIIDRLINEENMHLVKLQNIKARQK